MPQQSRRAWRPLRSVRSRIIAWMLLVTAIGMLVAGGVSYAIQRDRTLRDIDDALAMAAEDAPTIAADATGPTLSNALESLVRGLRPGAGQGGFAIIDGSVAIVPGGVIALHPEDDPAFVTRVAAETATGEVVRGTANTPDAAIRYVAIPVSVSGDASAGVFVLATDLGAALAPIDRSFETFAVVATISLVGVGVVGWLVSGRLLSPIRRLRETAARITASDLGERIEVVGSDDVSDLTVTVNDMLDRLDSALSGQRRLLDDVGHELKTPITIVRGHLEVMHPDDPRDVASTRALAIDELDRMGGLVRDISELAAVHRPLHVRVEPTGVRALTETVRAKASALSSAHEWAGDATADVTARLDPERITQAMLQLAANAVAHGAASGRIAIDSAVAGDRLHFRISDDGPGLQPDVADRVFERFSRGSGGRGTGGSGLGLAIVAAIAEAHGGMASVTSEPGHGAAFTIDLPWERVDR